MPSKKTATGTGRTDPDDAPELTDAMLDRADFYDGDKLIRRGRAPVATDGTKARRAD